MKRYPEFVQCRLCRKSYEKLAPTLKQQRKLADADGWRVGIPEWTYYAGMTAETWAELHPDRKHSLVDTCPQCTSRRMDVFGPTPAKR